MNTAAAPLTIGDPYAVPERRKPSEGTYAVNGVRARVDAWRAQGYPGALATSRRLLGFWFADEHRFEDGRPFRFYFCQREAVETFIYLTEIEPVRGLKDLLEFSEHGMTIQPGEPKRQRLAMKMATGSGKTMAMSLCIVWSYFHALYEADSPMTTSFLVIAPNLIVFERLKADFGDAATFRRDPLIPPEWSHDFDLTVLLQADAAPVTARGVLYLTNVQRLYEPAAGRGESRTAPNPVEAMLGPRVDSAAATSAAEQLFDRVAERQRVMVINDEAHHVHDEKLQWNQSIERLHEELRRRAADDRGAGVVSQLDYSATPKYEKGGVFRHVVVDYPLARRIDYLDDPHAPAANSLVLSVNVAVADNDGRLLLIRRSDNQNWALPGGAMECGETIEQAAVRETSEEAGIDCEITGMVGIYTNPRHVILYTSNDEVRQECSVVFSARATGGNPTPSSESSEVRWVPPSELRGFSMHPSMRQRVEHCLAGFDRPYIG